MLVRLLVKGIVWDVPEELLDLEPLSDEAPLEDHIKRMFQEIPDKVKELYPELPNEAEVEITVDKDDLNEDGTIYSGVLASIVNYALLDEYGYGANAMGDFEILEGELNINNDE